MYVKYDDCNSKVLKLDRTNIFEKKDDDHTMSVLSQIGNFYRLHDSAMHSYTFAACLEIRSTMICRMESFLIGVINGVDRLVVLTRY